jgi:hypothetical protein
VRSFPVASASTRVFTTDEAALKTSFFTEKNDFATISEVEFFVGSDLRVFVMHIHDFIEEADARALVYH